MKLFKDKNLSKKSIISIICLLFVIGGIFGFIYEEIFYKIDLGYFVKRGSTFGPWIPIYGYGSLLIVLMSYWARKKPWLVFVLNCLVTGILELGTGFVLDKYFNLRLWNYNEEIWNWGNYNGYICIRSVLIIPVHATVHKFDSSIVPDEINAAGIGYSNVPGFQIVLLIFSPYLITK